MFAKHARLSAARRPEMAKLHGDNATYAIVTVPTSLDARRESRTRFIMSGTLSNITISITPFDEAGRLDEAAFRRHLRRLAEAGVWAYVAGSGSSEGYTLSAEERDRVFEIAVEELRGKVQVRAMGCEPHVPREMVDYLRSAERHKVDAAMIFSLSGANCASTISTPSGPVSTPMRPPSPSSP